MPMTKPQAKSQRLSDTAALIAARVAALDWARILADLDTRGVATTGALLTPAECAALAAMYPDETAFRSHIIMARHGFGKGEYKYFSRPLPALVDGLRSSLFPQLAPLANRWSEAMKLGVSYPGSLDEFLTRCHDAGQTRPTPLLLKYEAGDYNCLHQDLYGANVFPLQVAFLLSRPGVDFEGGEFVLVEQRPRMQSRPDVVPLLQGEGVIFAVHNRPVVGTKGTYRVNLRHGVSRVRSGQRFTTGIIFHDAT
jgi:uncharacterized protein